jgi:hypothetical protein
MATSSYAKTLLGSLPADMRRAFGEVMDYLLNNSIAFGPIEADQALTRTTNLAGRYVKLTTSTTAGVECSAAHGLGRAPNVVWQVTTPTLVNSRFLGDLTVSRAADATRVYFTSTSVGATVFLYVE